MSSTAPTPNPLAESQAISIGIRAMGLRGNHLIPLQEMEAADLLLCAVEPHPTASPDDLTATLLATVARDLRLLRPMVFAQGFQRRRDIRAAIAFAAHRLDVAAELHRRALLAVYEWGCQRAKPRPEAPETDPDAKGGA